MKNKLLLLLIAATFVLGSCKKEDDEDPNPQPTSTPTTNTPSESSKKIEVLINGSVVTKDTVSHDFGTAFTGTSNSVDITFKAYDTDYYFDFESEKPLSYPNWDYNVQSSNFCGAFNGFAFSAEQDTLTVKKGETATVTLTFSPNSFNYSVFNGYDQVCPPNFPQCFPVPNCTNHTSNGVGAYNSTITFSYTVNGVAKKVTLDVSGTGESESKGGGEVIIEI